MADTGFLSPGSSRQAATGTVTWSNVGNLLASDNAYATAVLTVGQQPKNLFTYNFSASAAGIVSGDTINGFEIEIEGSANAAPIINGTAVLFKDCVAETGSSASGAGTGIATSESVTTVGSSTELFGSTWTADDVLATNFGVELTGIAGGFSGTTYNLDRIRLKIYYTPAPPETITFIGRTTNAGPLVEGTDFNGVDIGDAAADRKVIAVFFGIWNQSGSTDSTPDFSLTIDSNAMDVIVAPTTAGTDGNGNRSFCGIFALDYPTGTTADFSLAFPDATFFDASIFVYAGNGLGALLDTATLGEASGDGVGSLDLNTVDGGAAVGGVGGYTLSTPNAVWVGLDEDDQQSVYGNDIRSSASFSTDSDESPRTITATIETGGSLYLVGASASWEPAGEAPVTVKTARSAIIIFIGA